MVAARRAFCAAELHAVVKHLTHNILRPLSSQDTLQKGSLHLLAGITTLHDNGEHRARKIDKKTKIALTYNQVHYLSIDLVGCPLLRISTVKMLRPGLPRNVDLA